MYFTNKQTNNNRNPATSNPAYVYNMASRAIQRPEISALLFMARAEKVREREERHRRRHEEQKKREDRKRDLEERKREREERKREREERKRERDEKKQQHEQNEMAKIRIKERSIRKMFRTAKALQRECPDGFTPKQLVQKYIELNGEINPYTLEIVSNDYDIDAAIRGFMYETSPSSQQHWFKYGVRKERNEIAPWLFYNKELAIVNNQFDWRVSTPEMAAERRRCKGKWFVLEDGPNTYYDWNTEIYGPLPTNVQLKNASRRKSGFRSK